MSLCCIPSLLTTWTVFWALAEYKGLGVWASCPVWSGNAPPKPSATCDGRNRTVIKAKDDRSIFNMTGHEALKIIDLVNKNREECWKLSNRKLVPILNIRYESNQFKKQADTAVRTANQMSDLLTKGMCVGDLKQISFLGDPTQFLNDQSLYTMVRSNVESDPSIAGSAIIFKKNVYKNRQYFAPYAFKRKTDSYIRVEDLSLTWGPLQMQFMEYVENITKPRSFLCRTSILTPRANGTSAGSARYYTHVNMEFSDGIWARPYFECHASQSWILSYVSPFMTITYDIKNSSPITFLGGVSIDVDLNKVDINQCDLDNIGKFPFEVFAGTHHCKKDTTKCVHVPGLGFSVGSYRCACKDGYYFPVLGAKANYFNGTEVEEDVRTGAKRYSQRGQFECFPCKEGCNTCVDDSPCIVSFNLPLRYTILCFTTICMGGAIILAWTVYARRKIKVMKSASPKFLLITLLGACLMYLELIMMFARANDVTCAMKPWLWNIGFALMIGALLLKNWRISQIFQIKSAKRIRITDEMLLRKLVPIMGFYSLYLSTWTVTSAPHAVERTNDEKLKFYVCSEDWWDYAILIGNCLFMLWGIYLCYTIRKAPSAFNESKFISWSIYNITVVTALMRLMRAFLIKEAGPDTGYLLEFIQLHLTVSVLVALVFLPKIVRIAKGRGNESDVNSAAMRSKSLYGGGSSNDTMQMAQENETLKTEIRKLYAEIELIKLAKIDEEHRKVSRTISLLNEVDPSPSHSPSKEDTRKAATALATQDQVGSGDSSIDSPKVELVSYI